jgi:hypothetical protein
MTIRTTLPIAAAIAIPSTAFADDELSARDVAGAPTSGDESGRTDPSDDGDGAGRRIGRGLLFVPRVAARVVLAPAEATAWALERFQLIDRARRLFFNDAGTVGLFPTLQLDSGFGVNAGARFVHRDLLGASEKLSVRASAGGRFRQRYAVAFDTGDRFGPHVVLDARAEYELRPTDPFYGLGNADMATETRFRQRIARVTGGFETAVAGDLHLRGAGSLADRVFDRASTGEPIDDVHMPAGFADGTRNGYGELELRWDSRRRTVPWEPLSIFTTGTLAAVFAGRTVSLDGGADFWRYGIDLQRFVRLAAGPRVLALRAHGEAVTGPRDEVPFTELPRLGGKTVLRGYPADRFRDRVAMFGSADYQWDLARSVSASLFVDAGRVSASVRDAGVTGLRVGYGVGIDLHTDRSFLARASLASSIDGGVFLNLALDPVFELDERVDRR